MASRAQQAVRDLLAREEIRELRATYCFLVDERRFSDLVEKCFTEDAGIDFRATDASLPPFVGKGRAELLHFFSGVVGNLFSFMAHTVHNHRIVLAGEEASGDCYFEFTGVEAASGSEVVGTGRYIDRYCREDGTWRISHRRADIFYMTTLKDGWATRRFLKALT